MSTLPTTSERPGQFGVQTTQADGSLIVRVSGELDLATAPMLEDALAGIEAGEGPVVLDLSALTFIDSTGLRLAVRLHARCVGCARELEIRPGPPAVQRVFELTHLDDALPFRR
jgi:anti-anti-sigma factor